MRERRGVTQAYGDFGRTPSIPAFVVSAKQLVKNINSMARGQQSARTTATGTNNLALRPRASTKRTADLTDHLSSSSKRAKTEPPAASDVIDLTQDEEPTPKLIASRRLPLQPVHANTMNRGPGPKNSQKRRKNPLHPQEQDSHLESLAILAKIASKLRASAHTLDVDRGTLRQRWEVDSGLQLQHVTDGLADLNECFTTAENGIHAALEVIEKRLL